MIGVLKVRQVTALAVAGVLAGAVTVAAGVMPGGDGSSAANSLTVGSGKGKFPTETVRDWVTYGDQLAVIKIQSERERLFQHDNPDEGMIGRAVTVEVEKTLWSREGAPPAPKSSFEIGVPGWTLHDGKRTEFAIKGSPRVEVGSTYVAVLVRLASDQWVPLGGEAIFPYRDDVLGRGEQKGGISRMPARQQVEGKSANELVELLRNTSPDPDAAGITTSDPEEKARTVWERRKIRSGE